MPITLLNTTNQGSTTFQNVSGVGRIVISSGTVSAPTGSSVLYSNFEQYIINGVRQATTTSLIRANITTSRRLIVTETITIQGFVLLRIPPSNWTSISNGDLRPSLSVVSGTGATIDGGTTTKLFYSQSVVYNPNTVGARANTTSQYDTYTMRPTNNSSTVLTAGEYTLTAFSTGANFDLATLTNSVFPIDTTKKIYPSTTAATTHFAMQVF